MWEVNLNQAIKKPTIKDDKDVLPLYCQWTLEIQIEEKI